MFLHRAMASHFLVGPKISEPSFPWVRARSKYLARTVVLCPKWYRGHRLLHYSRQGLLTSSSISDLFASTRPSRLTTNFHILHSSRYVHAFDILSNLWRSTYLLFYRANSWRHSITLCLQACLVRNFSRIESSSRVRIVRFGQWFRCKAATPPARGWWPIEFVAQLWNPPDTRVFTIVGISASMVD